MKMNRFFICVIAMLLLISSISIGNNISRVVYQEHVRKAMINNTYFELKDISSNLNDILLETDTQATDYTTMEKRLTFLACDFTQLHTTLKYYAMSFPPKGQIRSSYTGTIDFEHIAYTLTAGIGKVNNNSYSGLLEDGVISEEELQYLTILKNDIDIMIESMTSSENPLQENPKLTTTQIDYILKIFFDKWSWNKENSPYFLLCK